MLGSFGSTRRVEELSTSSPRLCIEYRSAIVPVERSSVRLSSAIRYFFIQRSSCLNGTLFTCRCSRLPKPSRILLRYSRDIGSTEFLPLLNLNLCLCLVILAQQVLNLAGLQRKASGSGPLGCSRYAIHERTISRWRITQYPTVTPLPPLLYRALILPLRFALTMLPGQFPASAKRDSPSSYGIHPTELN